MQSCGHEEAIDDWTKQRTLTLREFTLMFEVNCFSQFLPFSVIFEQPFITADQEDKTIKKFKQPRICIHTRSVSRGHYFCI